MVPGAVSTKSSDQFWFQKRKLEKLRCDTNILNDEENDSLNSMFHRVEKDGTLYFSYRKTGDDGHYYECVICDKGGDLLCCDTCPSVFHLECLSPPLEHVPAGNWHCADCNKQDDLLMPLKDLKRSLRRKTSSFKREKHATTKKLDFHIPANIISSGCPADENPSKQMGESQKAQSFCETDQIKVYRRSRTRRSARKEEFLESSGLTEGHGHSKHNTEIQDDSTKAGFYRQANRDLMRQHAFGSVRQEEKPEEEQMGAIVPQKVDGHVCTIIPQSYEQVQDTVESSELFTVIEAWLEEELDALWIGVRRHGAGNWEAMLMDPMLICLKSRTSEALSEKWKIERKKILDLENSQAPVKTTDKQPESELQLTVPARDYHQAARPNGLLKIHRPRKSSGKTLSSTEAVKSQSKFRCSYPPLKIKNDLDGKLKARTKRIFGDGNAENDINRKDDSATESELSLKEWCMGKEVSSEGTISD